MQPIKKGDLCDIIEGALGNESPNVGKRITVGLFMGEHSQFGNIWTVHGQNLITEYGAVGDVTQCAASWLRKVEPPKMTKNKMTTLTEKI